ncbi:hypothetical protein MJH12_06490 [bacterium]|nr:hypothetical protein [bacterium]
MDDQLEELKLSLNSYGFDIVHPFLVSWYNQKIQDPFKLPQYDDSSFALLIGNTKKLWPHFTEFYVKDSTLQNSEHPLNDYCEKKIPLALAQAKLPAKIRFSHKAEPYHIAFQKLAEMSGFAYLNRAHLCVHEEYGPWFALRAVLVFDYQKKLDLKSISNPCLDCDKNCIHHFQQVIHTLKEQKVRDNWQSWLKIRDSCPIGKDYRYSEDQILYHYTKQKLHLESNPI